ncbi:MAG: glycosyltransferase family 4 protein [Candidatus Brocadiaceae bacterium]|nr:glycosyltransferase family 4 protein [Candidatus Brocadiaceae bacterium]
MNILCINHEYPPVGGGASSVARELLGRFYKNGHSVTLLTESVPENTRCVEEPEFPVFRIHAGRKSVSRGSYLEFILFFFKAAGKLREINRLHRADITLAFFTFPGGLLALVQKWWYGTPYILSIRGGDIPGFVVDKKLAFFHLLSSPLIKLICKKADLVHTNSGRLEELALKLIPDLFIKVIPNGAVFREHQFFEKTDNEMLKIIFVGRLSKQKNLNTFLLGLSMLPEDIKRKSVFTILGEGPEKDNLIKMVKTHGLSGIVQFQGWMGRENLRKKYESHTFSVLPSIDEGMPNAALESIASGCPVLGSRYGSLSWEDDRLKKFWIVENERDGRAWKDRIVELYRRRNEIGEDFRLMREYAERNFNWDIIIHDYENMLQSICGVAK